MWSIGGPYRNFDLSNIFFPPPPPCIDNDWSLKTFFFKLVLECLQAQSEAPLLLLCKFIKITKTVWAPWLNERSVCMMVCKHGSVVASRCIGFNMRADHASMNLKQFLSSKLDKFTLFTYSFVSWNLENLYKQGVSIFLRLSWHFKWDPYFGKHLFAKQELIARLHVQDFATGKNSSFNHGTTKSSSVIIIM